MKLSDIQKVNNALKKILTSDEFNSNKGTMGIVWSPGRKNQKGYNSLMIIKTGHLHPDAVSVDGINEPCDLIKGLVKFAAKLTYTATKRRMRIGDIILYEQQDQFVVLSFHADHGGECSVVDASTVKVVCTSGLAFGAQAVYSLPLSDQCKNLTAQKEEAGR